MMDKQQTLEALRLHSVTHGHLAYSASQRGDFESATRYQQISNAAAAGRLLAPTALESHMPDLLAAAQAHGLVDGEIVPNRGVQDEAGPVVRRVGGHALAPELPAGVEPTT
jgi:hypothetical protein